MQSHNCCWPSLNSEHTHFHHDKVFNLANTFTFATTTCKFQIPRGFTGIKQGLSVGNSYDMYNTSNLVLKAKKWQKCKNNVRKHKNDKTRQIVCRQSRKCYYDWMMDHKNPDQIWQMNTLLQGFASYFNKIVFFQQYSEGQ